MAEEGGAFAGDATWMRQQARNKAREAEANKIKARHATEMARRKRLATEEFDRQLMSGDKTAADMKVRELRKRLEKRGVNTRKMRHRRVLQKKLQELIDIDRAAMLKDKEAENFRLANMKSIFGEGEGISDTMTKQWAADRAKTRGRPRGLGSRMAHTRLYHQYGCRLLLALSRDPPDLNKGFFIFGQADRAFERLPESKFILKRNQRRVNVNAQNQYGRTALMYCAIHAQDDYDRYWDLSQLILNERGVNVNKQDNDGVTARQYARRNGNEDMALAIESKDSQAIYRKEVVIFKNMDIND